MILSRILTTLLALFIAALGSGDLRHFVTDPLTGTWCWLTLIGSTAGALTGFNFSTGIREVPRQRWIVMATGPFWLALAWYLPWAQRHDLMTVKLSPDQGILPLALVAAGLVMRTWPMWVLGTRFSAFVAIQEGHQVCTRGPYRWIRHPSYLGMLMWYLGTILLFGSLPGLCLVMPLLALSIGFRIRDEEALLASHFGAEYEDYRRACPWRMVPGMW